MKILGPFIVVWGLMAGVAFAEATSAYTKLDIENDCKPFGKYEEEGQSGALICPAHADLSIILSYGDLRESVGVYFEPEENQETGWYSFSQWNAVNNVFEFRMLNDIPRATIHRVFIDNIDPDTGSADKKRQGQMLVITSIALKPGAQSCMIGVVDALANKNANKLAREVADTLSTEFSCDRDKPRYHGVKGPRAGTI